jgi:glycosidase
MEDFIFGKLPSPDERLRRIAARRAGITHQQDRQPFHPLPGQAVTLRLSLGPNQHFERAWVYWTTEPADPQGRQGRATRGSAVEMTCVRSEWDTPLWGYLRHFEVVLPGQPAGTVVRYRIGAGGPNGEETLADDGALYSYYVDDDPPPAWTRAAVLYQIFVDRFNPGAGHEWLNPADLSGFYGGRIRGITEKLADLAALGMTVLWLSPIFTSDTHHGYDSKDLYEVEPRLGTKADLRELLDEAHQRGMRVLLDLVPNHISNLHPIFQHASTIPNSPYRDWFTFTRWPEEYACFFGNLGMPRLNLRYPAARQYLLDAVAYWLAFGVDGFRVDHAIGPVPDFWADFRRTTRSVKPDSWTFGEVTDPPDVQLTFTGGMDGCLDFLLAETLRSAFAAGRWDGLRLADFLTRHDSYFPPSFSRPSFLDNHDMNRFLWAAHGDQRRLRLAALCQFSLPGQPVIYHGTEVGLSQDHDVHAAGRGLEEARLPHPWGEQQNPELLAFYQALIALRRSHPVIWTGRREVITSDPHCLAYQLISAASGQPELCVALNLSSQAQLLSVDPGWNRLLLATQPGCTLQEAAGQKQVQLAPLSGLVLAR